jgi:hypothetical protein
MSFRRPTRGRPDARRSSIFAIALIVTCLAGGLSSAAWGGPVPTLTLSAGGEPLTSVGAKKGTSVTFTDTGELRLFEPSTGLSVTCAPSNGHWLFSGRLQRNGVRDDLLRMSYSVDIGEPRHCPSNHGNRNVYGLQLLGRLQVRGNGEGAMSIVHKLQHAFIIGDSEGCDFNSYKLSSTNTVSGDLEVSFHDTLTSTERGCEGRTVEIEIGPFIARLEDGQPVEVATS